MCQNKRVFALCEPFIDFLFGKVFAAIYHKNLTFEQIKNTINHCSCNIFVLLTALNIKIKSLLLSTNVKLQTKHIKACRRNNPARICNINHKRAILRFEDKRRSLDTAKKSEFSSFPLPSIEQNFYFVQLPMRSASPLPALPKARPAGAPPTHIRFGTLSEQNNRLLFNSSDRLFLTGVQRFVAFQKHQQIAAAFVVQTNFTVWFTPFIKWNDLRDLRRSF